MSEGKTRIDRDRVLEQFSRAPVIVVAITAQKFDAAGDKRISGPSTGRVTMAPNFVVDDAMIADFLEHLKTQRVKIDDAAFAKDREFVRAMIRYRIDEALFGKSEALRRMVPVDPQAQLGLTMFDEAEKLKGLSKRPTRAN